MDAKYNTVESAELNEKNAIKNNYPMLMEVSKAYDNKSFLHSYEGRTIRILAEYLHPEQYFKAHNVKRTIVLFGSARTLSNEKYEIRLKQLNDKLANPDNEKAKNEITKRIDALTKTRKMTDTYQDAVKLSELLGKWSLKLPEEDRYYICTGGGPGMMEAGNRGATRAGHPSIGLNISLPFEQEPNVYISPELNFEFHYFFMRKYWFVFMAKAMVALPGGFGTLDELMEILTLIQTQKVTRRLPIVLYNKEFWNNLINFDYLVEMGMISPGDLDLFVYCNTPEEAFEYITDELSRMFNIK